MEALICKYVGREDSNQAPEEANWRRRSALQTPETVLCGYKLRQSRLRTERLDVNNS